MRNIEKCIRLPGDYCVFASHRAAAVFFVKIWRMGEIHCLAVGTQRRYRSSQIVSRLRSQHIGRIGKHTSGLLRRSENGSRFKVCAFIRQQY